MQLLRFFFGRPLLWMLWLGLSWSFMARAAAPQAPDVAARAYVLLDVTSGQWLASKEPDMPVEPASLTKLMTAYLVFDALKSGKLDLKQTFPVSERAWKMPGSRMFIDPRMKVAVEDLLKGMIVQSGNDATTALAEGLGGSVEQFVEMMNRQAKALGMASTSFRNPEGLPAPGHMTTARDLAVLATRLMRDFPEYVPFYAIQRYRYPGSPEANATNRNLLLFRDPSVDGLKTGHTDAAGYCLIATAHRAQASMGEGALGDRRLLSVMLGAASDNARAAESQKLLNWGFTAWSAVRLTAPGVPLVSPRVWKGKSATAGLGRPEGVVVSVPALEVAGIRTNVTRPDPLVAPLHKGQSMGVLQVRGASGDILVEVPLSVLETVEESGVLGRAWDSLRLWIQ